MCGEREERERGEREGGEEKEEGGGRTAACVRWRRSQTPEQQSMVAFEAAAPLTVHSQKGGKKGERRERGGGEILSSCKMPRYLQLIHCRRMAARRRGGERKDKFDIRRVDVRQFGLRGGSISLSPVRNPKLTRSPP